MPDLIPNFDSNLFLDTSGGCLNNDNFQNAFDWINILADSMSLGTDDLECEQIEAEISASSLLGPQTICLVEKVPVNPLTSGETTCYFMLNMFFDFSASDSGAQFVTGRADFKILCDGIAVYSGRLFQGSLVGEHFFEARCLEGAKIELEVDFNYSIGQFVSDGDFVPSSYQYNVGVCGGRLCVNTRDISQPNSRSPCLVVPDCKYGFPSIAQIRNNLNALGKAFSFTGFAVDVYTAQTDDTATSQQIGPVLDSDSVYIVFGYTKINFGESFASLNSVDLQVQVGCPSSTSTCLRTSTRPPITSALVIGATSVVVPFSVCGQCPEGETIYAGLNPTVNCLQRGGQEDPVASVFHTTETNYCVGIFSEIKLADPPRGVGAPLKVTSLEYIQSLNDEMARVHTAACSRKSSGMGSDSTNGNGTLGNLNANPTATELIFAASPPPPPPEPIYDRKLFITGDVRFYVCNPQTGNSQLEETTQAEVGWELLCGGAVIESGSAGWNIAGSGFFSPGGPTIQIAGISSCPITSPIEIRFSVINLVGNSSAIFFDICYSYDLTWRNFINA